MMAGKRVQVLDQPSLFNYGIIRGKPDRPISGWTPFDLVCRRRGKSPAKQWDYFDFPSTPGCISSRALKVLSPFLGGRLVPLPSKLERQDYYFLVAKECIDCLNVAECDPPYPGEVDHVAKYRFFLDRIPDPLIFTIPERPYYLFATESIPGIIEKAGLRGFELRSLHRG